MNKLRNLFELSVFGVCSHIGKKLGIASSSIRKYFIYLSFFTFGSPVILYLVFAFWLDISKHSRRSRSAVWDF